MAFRALDGEPPGSADGFGWGHHRRGRMRESSLIGDLFAEGNGPPVSNSRSMLTLIALSVLTSRPVAANDSLLQGWNDVPNDAKTRMYWRVFGPAWDKQNIDRQLQIVKKAGVGGVMTYFMYPFALDEPGKWHNQVFDSPEFLANMDYAIKRANQLGLRFGVCGSTGWPFGGSKVSLADSAQMLKKVEGVAKGGKLELAKPLSPSAGDRLIAIFQNGKLVKEPTDGPVVTFVQSPTRMQVKRASLGNEGLVVDHLNEGALDRYLKSTVEPMLQGNIGKVESIFSDSLEVYRENWTHDFPEEFEKLRGYDLIPELNSLFDDKNPDSGKLRQDFWRTVAELAETRYVKKLNDWSHQHKLQTELQPYGTPPLPMTSSAYIDMPTAEHYEWRGFNVCRYVSSAAHQEGKNVIGSEAWTWGAIPNRLTDTLSDLKLMSDMSFLSGVNDITGVDFPYSPAAAGIPGWLPYYGPSIGENNPQWAVFPELVKYLNRCSWMLRQGKPAAKVAVYLPIEDGMAKGGTEQLLLDFAVRDHFVTGPLTSEFGLKKAMTHRSDLVEALNREAIGFDGLDFWSLNQLGKVVRSADHTELSVGSMSYKVVVLPRIESIDLKSLKKLEAFWKAGGTLVATGLLPSKASGKGAASDDFEVRGIIGRIFSLEASLVPKRTGTGWAYYLPGDADLFLLGYLGVSQAHLICKDISPSVVRRDLKDGEIYFVANPTDAPVDYSLEPVPNRRALETWNPLTGKRTRVVGRLLNSRLPARGSQFIVARDHFTTSDNPPAGPPHFGPFPLKQELDTIGSDWTLRFVGPDAPPVQHLKDPVYWEGLADCVKFSGEGIYSTEFNAVVKPITLRLPPVHHAAWVTVNGKQAGSVWLPPYELDISKFVKQGVNRLEIHVFSSMANRFIGLPDMDIAALRAKYGGRFSAPEEKQLMKGPEHAGIEGPVLGYVTVQSTLRP